MLLCGFIITKGDYDFGKLFNKVLLSVVWVLIIPGYVETFEIATFVERVRNRRCAYVEWASSLLNQLFSDCRDCVQTVMADFRQIPIDCFHPLSQHKHPKSDFQDIQFWLFHKSVLVHSYHRRPTDLHIYHRDHYYRWCSIRTYR